MNHKQEVMNKVLTLKNKLETTGKLTPKNKQELKQILIDNDMLSWAEVLFKDESND